MPDIAATVIVAHASPLIRAGIVSMLRRLPRCAIRVWEPGRPCGSLEARAPSILIGDRDRVLQALGAGVDTAGGAAVKVVLLQSSLEHEAAPGLLPDGVEHRLSIECAEDELLETVRCLSEPRGDRRTAPRRVRPQAERGGLAPGVLRRVLDCIEGRLAERVSLAHLAESAGLSPCHFGRAFKQSRGLPPHRYILQRRIERAAGLMLDTDRPLADIAREVGFADHSHFTRAFAGAMGETPTAFRSRHR